MTVVRIGTRSIGARQSRTRTLRRLRGWCVYVCMCVFNLMSIFELPQAIQIGSAIGVRTARLRAYILMPPIYAIS